MEKDKTPIATTTIEIEVKVQTYDMNKGELIDAIASGSKLTKADAGRALDATLKDIFRFRIEPTLTAEGKLGCPKVDVEYRSKVIPTVNK